MLLRLAYRNIWRNRRRTLITAASILFAVFFAVVMRAIQVGAWQRMVDSVVHFYFGYAQVQAAGYWDERSIEQSLLYDDSLRNRLDQIAGLGGYTPRLESFALAAHEDQSRGALLIGIDPEAEDALTQLSSRVTEGSYFGDGGVLMSSGLAEYLDLRLGDTAVFVSQGYHGTNAAGKYAVSGI
ncbi:MAG: hypothetical protein R3330_02735, partial [Saprospiraceae bacterium]|nr:hypothetical protein [Saprospiraceae bacterium]